VRPDEKTLKKIQFLCRVVDKEARLLSDTRRRLFVASFNAHSLQSLDQHPDLADRIESFVARFGRLQDTAGDKLLPMLLASLGERLASVADNLDRAERLGLIASADDWFAMRALRNQMVHEYVEDPLVLWGALDAAKNFTDALTQSADKMVAEAAQRGWL
jgi:uncharacterized protein with HEPN domain